MKGVLRSVAPKKGSVPPGVDSTLQVLVGSALFMGGFGVWWVLAGSPRHDAGPIPVSTASNRTTMASSSEMPPSDPDLPGGVDSEIAQRALSTTNHGTKSEESDSESSERDEVSDDPETERFDFDSRGFDHRVALFDEELSHGWEEPELARSFTGQFQNLMDGMADLGARVSTRCTQSVCEIEIKSQVPTGTLIARSIDTYRRIGGYSSGDLRSYDESGGEVTEQGMRIMADAAQIRVLSKELARENPETVPSMPPGAQDPSMADVQQGEETPMSEQQTQQPLTEEAPDDGLGPQAEPVENQGAENQPAENQPSETPEDAGGPTEPPPAVVPDEATSEDESDEDLSEDDASEDDQAEDDVSEDE